MDYDPQVDAVGSYFDAIAEIGRRVRAGEPAPATGYFAIPNRKEEPMARSKAYDQKASPKVVAITPVEYSGLQAAYDHFNAELFAKSLDNVFITYQRKAHSTGYFAPNRFLSRTGEGGQHELALNPDSFIGRTDKQNLQTIVHEMVHVWQELHGKPSKRGYHNREWANQMIGIGLYPSSTGMPGGKETGQHMSDYIIPGGPYDLSSDRLAAKGWRLNLESAPRPGQRGGGNSKTKFTCGQCRQNVWGKPDAAVVCKFCGVDMLPETTSHAASRALKVGQGLTASAQAA